MQQEPHKPASDHSVYDQPPMTGSATRLHRCYGFQQTKLLQMCTTHTQSLADVGVLRPQERVGRQLLFQPGWYRALTLHASPTVMQQQRTAHTTCWRLLICRTRWLRPVVAMAVDCLCFDDALWQTMLHGSGLAGHRSSMFVTLERISATLSARSASCLLFGFTACNMQGRTSPC